MYLYSFGIDLVVLLLLLGIGYLAIFLIELHPLITFLSNYNLAYVNQHPEVLPEKSVLYSGIATLLVLILTSLLLSVIIFFKSRYLLFNKLVHNKWKVVKNKTATKLLLLQIPMLIIPLWFVLYILASILTLLTNVIPIETVVIFLQQLIMTVAVTIALFVLVEYSVFFYKKTIFFSNYPAFLKSLQMRKLGKVIGIISVFFLITFILQTILGNFYQIAFLESAYYYLISLISISIIRVETILQKA